MPATSKIRYADKALEEKHQKQVEDQESTDAANPRSTTQAPDAKGSGGREFGNQHTTQAENATTESGLADDVPGSNPTK